MWEVKKRPQTSLYGVFNGSIWFNYICYGLRMIYLTPYQSEAQELVDKLNGDSDD